MLISQILDYVQMTALSSVVKRSSAVLIWKVGVTVLIRDEESNYIQVATQHCCVKRRVLPFVPEVTTKLFDGVIFFKF